MTRRMIHAALAGLLGLLTVATTTGAAQAQPGQAEARTIAAAVELKQPPKPLRPRLRAGINEQQLQHAITIVETGQEMGLPRQAYVVAIATALQESQMSVLANVHVPHSFNYQPRDGYGRDHDSVGIFQQRVRYYCVNDLQFCMDPRYSAMKFYNDLKRVSGWESLPVTVAAQRVQRSAFPDHYAKHQGAAEMIVDSILEWQR
jgi:hypothetical protein